LRFVGDNLLVLLVKVYFFKVILPGLSKAAMSLPSFTNRSLDVDIYFC
jgi:hypothetical protein